MYQRARSAFCVLFLVGLTLRAQDVPEKNRIVLLGSARAQYYNLRTVGVKGFQCDVNVDWNSLFNSVNGKDATDTDPLLKYLRSSHIHFDNDFGGSPEVEWASTGNAPEAQQKQADRIRNGVKMMVSGFLTAWNPTLSGELIAEEPKVFRSTESGYVIHDTDKTGESELRLDKNLVVKHISAKTDQLTSEMDTDFRASPNGLLMTRMDGTTRQPPTSPPTHVTMEAQFAPIQTYLLPSAFTITVTNIAVIKMTFGRCEVDRSK